MKCLLAAINSKYIHSNPAVYLLKACADKRRLPGVETEAAEYTINHHAAEILDDIYLHHADLICFSCYIWNIDYVKTLVRNLKRICPNTAIWLGGPEVSYDCRAVLGELCEADGILYGEGEKSFPGLLEHYALGTAFPEGCAWIDGAGVFHQTEAPQPVAMEEIPFIYRGADKRLPKCFQNRILYYETSRGCPFSCSYCLSSIDKRLRFRPLGLVKEELAFFLEQRVPQVKFVDRTFNCKKEHAMEIWRFLRDHDNGVTNFHFEIAADLLDEEELDLLAQLRPGLVQLEIGVQTANPETIAAIHRRMDLKKVERVTGIIRRQQNIHQHLDLIAGLLLEDYQSFRHSFDVVYRMRPSQLQLGFLKVLKGSPMYEQAKQYGVIYQAEPPYEVLETPWLTHEELICLKGVEEMVEIYYNSGQFLNTIRSLEEAFESPFQLYEALAEKYRQNRMHEKKHRREAQYQFLLDFALGEKPRIRQLLTLDYYLREYAKKRPAFADEQDLYKEEIRAVCRRTFPLLPYKDVISRYHIEVFTPPFTKEKQFWLFDYEARDPLTGNAAVRILE